MKRIKILLLLLVLFSMVGTVFSQTALPPVRFPQSQLSSPLPTNLNTVSERRIITIRMSYIEWSTVIYRPDSAPLNTINVGGGRVERFPIPLGAVPASGGDHHLDSVVNGIEYELYDASRTSSTSFSVIGAVPYPVYSPQVIQCGANHVSVTAQANGFSACANQRTTAWYGSITLGMITREDLVDAFGNLNCVTPLRHALTAGIPSSLVNGDTSTGYISPALGSETKGTAGSGGIRMGELFRFPSTLTDEQIDSRDILPITRLVVRAVRDYGLYIGDSNSATDTAGTATFRVEPNTLDDACGRGNDALLPTVGNQVAAIITQFGLLRVIGGQVSTSTPPPLTPISTPTLSPTLRFTPTLVFTGTPPLAGTACGYFPHNGATPVSLNCR